MRMLDKCNFCEPGGTDFTGACRRCGSGWKAEYGAADACHKCYSGDNNFRSHYTGPCRGCGQNLNWKVHGTSLLCSYCDPRRMSHYTGPCGGCGRNSQKVTTGYNRLDKSLQTDSYRSGPPSTPSGNTNAPYPYKISDYIFIGCMVIFFGGLACIVIFSIIEAIMKG